MQILGMGVGFRDELDVPFDNASAHGGVRYGAGGVGMGANNLSTGYSGYSGKSNTAM